MASTFDSRQTVFRQIARQSYADWSAYDSTPLYDRASLPALESDVRVVSQTWFRHDDHYAGSTSYGMTTLFRVFVLKECYEWDHETELVGYLNVIPCSTISWD